MRLRTAPRWATTAPRTERGMACSEQPPTHPPGRHHARSRYFHCVCVLAFEQPGRQLHRGAEFRDSGQSHRQSHIHHARL